MARKTKPKAAAPKKTKPAKRETTTAEARAKPAKTVPGTPKAKAPKAKAVTIALAGGETVSGLLVLPRGARALYVLAHGAGAGMAHPFLAAMAALLSARGIGTLRYQFPYMVKKSRRPDSPEVAQAAVRAAVATAAELAPKLPLLAGGKSFGGRMTSQAEAAGHLSGVAGLVFLGFPLHPPGAPATARGEHLSAVGIPMLFLQGTHDEFADLDLLKPLAKSLGRLATLHLVPDGNHSFHVPMRAGRSDAEVLADLADTIAGWVDRVAAG